ncbi:MAG: hypothetical protein ACFE8A_15255 [Candidatus Hodarchaeota archaeon]
MRINNTKDDMQDYRNKSKKKIYKYHDGSGNTYIIKSEFIEYRPIKPSISSSGFYDGGNYIKKQIRKLQYNKIILILKEAIRNKEIHIKNRVKMSSMIIIQEKFNREIYILNPNSKELFKIEKMLQDIIKN